MDLIINFFLVTFPQILIGLCSPNLFVDMNFLISTVISNGSEYKFSFGHENLFTSVMGLLQINAGLLVSINAEN